MIETNTNNTHTAESPYTADEDDESEASRGDTDDEEVIPVKGGSDQ